MKQKMKYSEFNSIIKMDSKYLIYNSYRNKYLFIGSEIKYIIEHTSIDLLKEIHSTFYQVMVNNGFIVKSEIDEFTPVFQKIHDIQTDDKGYILIINPTMNCNFKCWYCYENHNKHSQMTLDTLDKVKLHIDNIINDNPKLEYFSLRLFGGEPLLYFSKVCLPIMSYFTEICQSRNIKSQIGFTTNGSLINMKMIESFQNFENIDFFQITIDGMKDDHDKVRFFTSEKGSFETIIKNIINLVNNRFTVNMRINYVPDKLKDVHYILKYLDGISEDCKSFLSISLHCVWQLSDTSYIPQELLPQMKLFHNSGYSVDSHLRLHNIHNVCYGDINNSSTINFNGDVFKCTARDFTEQNREGVLLSNGLVNWNKEKITFRMDSKFYNKPCLSCRILPICGGGCSQNKLEKKKQGVEYCFFDFDNQKIDNYILFKLEELLLLDRSKNIYRTEPTPLEIINK